MRLDFEDGTYVIENKGEDTFFYGFNQYLFLRDSCYHCKYTGEERVADFTIADFWGVDLKKIPDLQRRYGVSLILFNSDKANKLMENLERDMYLEAINPEEAIPYNQALVMPSSLNENRTCFFKKLGKKSFDSLIFRFNWKFYTKIRSKKRAMQFLGEKNYYRLKNIKNFLKKLIRPF